MANHKSAAKRARQSIRRTARNNLVLKTLRNSERKLREALSAKDKDQASELFSVYERKMGKATQKGLIHKRKMSRKVGQLAKLFNGVVG